MGATEKQPIGDSAETKRHRKKLVLLTVTMTIVTMLVSGIGMSILYRIALAQQRSLLEETVKSQAGLIEAIARTTGDRQTILKAILDAQNNFPGFGKTGKLILATRQGEQIVFVNSTRDSDRNTSQVLPSNSKLANEIQRSLSGDGGSVIVADERGEKVIAAYQSLAGLNWIVVAKIDLEEIRFPFLKATAIAAGLTFAVIFTGMIVFFAMANELIEKLKQMHAQKRVLLETTPDGIITISDRGRIQWINATAAQLFGYNPAEAIGKNVKLLMPWLPHQQIDAYLRLSLNTGQTSCPEKSTYELVGQRKNGVTFPLELAISEATFSRRRMFTLFVRDITERKRAKEELQASYALLSAVTEGTADPIFVKDLQGRYVMINSAGAAALGQSASNIIGKNDLELLSLETARKVMKNDRRITMEGQTQILEEVITPLAEGTNGVVSRTYLTTKTVYRSSQGHIKGLIGVARDISDRVKAETTLRQTVAILHATSQELQEKNQQLETTSQELQEKNQQLETAIAKLQRTQTQLIQSEKMSSLGQMVAGIAHEINNPVNFISGNLIYLSDYTQDLLDLLALYDRHYPEPITAIADKAESLELDFLKEDLGKILGSMKVGTERIRELVLSLRVFSRLDEAEMKPVDIHQGIESTLLILQGRLHATLNRPAIKIIKEFGNLPPIECYASQLNQVFMNILNNAIDALEQKSEVCDPHPTASIQHSDVRTHFSGSILTSASLPTILIRTKAIDEGTVAIVISDNGPGMTSEVQARLFDPFFTTKPVGKGTGLGLSICYQIVVEKHKGQIACVSAPEEGACFTIEIPISQGLT